MTYSVGGGGGNTHGQEDESSNYAILLYNRNAYSV